MKIIAPDYYANFACIKGNCRHSCCVGWEIDIDDASLKRFHAVQGPLGERLRESIAGTQGSAYFRLTKDERCPFLNEEGLCDLILELGEDCLCQICDDHPRFRNFFSDREEVGLGLCCEAAGRLILGKKDAVRLMTIADDGVREDIYADEADLLELRDALISLAQDRTLALQARLRRILDECALEMKPFLAADWRGFLLGLERLDERWADRLETLLPECLESGLAQWESAFEQLLVYLIYRHLPAALEDDDLRGHVAYIVFAWQLVRALCEGADAFDFEEMVEICRLYSSEIEYSDENIAAIIGHLYELNPDL